MLSACGEPETRGPTDSVTSPDGASVVETYYVSGGGAAGFAYQELWMRTSGFPVGSAFARISHAKGLSVAWASSDTLVVFFADGSVRYFESDVYDASRQLFIKVELCRLGSVTCPVTPETLARKS